MISLIDADGFFANCELARHPQLRGKPVMILGRIGSFVLAKTQEAKLRGVTTVMRYSDAKQLCPDGIFLEGDFRFYTQMSRKLMTILKTYSPRVEVSSIDEAYMDMSGLEELHQKTYLQIGDMIRKDVERQLGITVSVGISLNKVLAKMACETNKPNGTTVIFEKDISEFLSCVKIEDIPGIGRRRMEALKKYGLTFALQFRQLTLGIVKSLFGRNGIMLWKELYGEYMFRVNAEGRIPKQIGRTSSLPKATFDLKMIEGLAFYHLERSIESLHRHKLATKELHLYLRDSKFKHFYLPHTFRQATDDCMLLTCGLKRLIDSMAKGRSWRSAGVLLSHLQDASVKQLSLFEDTQKRIQSEKLNQAKDQLNKRYGQFTVSSASTLFLKKKKKQRKDRFNLPFLS